MTSLPAFVRMVYLSPLVGTASFLLSLVWLLPVAATAALLWHPSIAPSVAALDDTIARALNDGAAALGTPDVALPGWLAPATILAFVPSVLIYAFAAQRTAMLMAGTARRAPSPGALLRNGAEWMVLVGVLQAMMIAVVVIGIGYGLNEAFPQTFGIAALDNLPVFLAQTSSDFGRALWANYAYFPMLCVGTMGLFFVFGGRYSALLSAFLEGNVKGGLGMGATCALCSLIFGYILYAVLAGGCWVWNTFGGDAGLPLITVSLWELLLVHVALFWSWMSAAAAYAGRREVDRCLEELAERAGRMDGAVVMGAMRDVPPDAENDLLIRKLRDWEGRKAA